MSRDGRAGEKTRVDEGSTATVGKGEDGAERLG